MRIAISRDRHTGYGNMIETAFENYQRMQLPARAKQLSKARFWVVFAANEVAETVFLGVYQASSPELNQMPVLLEVQPGMAPALTHHIFRTEPLPYLSWSAGSMKVDWGGSTIGWVQDPLRNPKIITTFDGAGPVGAAQERGRHRTSDSVLGAIFHQPPALSDWTASARAPLSIPSQPIDVISWMMRIERRSTEHETLVRRVASKAAGHKVEASQLLDLIVDRHVKSLGDDPVNQVRAALAQLYHYRFVYRDQIPSAKLLAVFGFRPSHHGTDLVSFLDGCDIGVAWIHGQAFEGTLAARQSAPWLFEASV